VPSVIRGASNPPLDPEEVAAATRLTQALLDLGYRLQDSQSRNYITPS